MVEILVCLLMSCGINCTCADITVTKDNVEGNSGKEKVNFIDAATGQSFVAIGTEQSGWGLK